MVRALPLGELLHERKLLTQAQLNDSLAKQRSSQSLMGKVLVGEGYVSPRQLHQAVAEQYALPCIDLISNPPDAALLAGEDIYTYLALQALPWRSENGETVIATCRITGELHSWARERFGAYRFVITSPYDIDWTIEDHFGALLDKQSRLSLWHALPHLSARVILPGMQKLSFAGGFAALAAACVLFPGSVLVAVMVVLNIFYLCTIALKMILFAEGARRNPYTIERKDFTGTIPDHALPAYTILVPLYQEAASLPQLLGALNALDYPRSKLDIKLIIESDDAETLAAAKALKPQGHIEIIRVPYSLPRTKPKACNYALKFARGDYVTIYDAEDKPDPLQLKKAVQAFADLPSHIVCLQARLNYYNYDDNLLTRLFAIEYGAWFDYMLPGLQSLGIPMPLGGTSNHIALTRLRELGEWDPYNVTEDADLGIRISLSDFNTAMIDSYTMEEAPGRFGAWLRQRSRWIKGYMQTWLVHMRSPLTLYRKIGAAGFFGFQFFIGGPCLVFLLAPFLWSISIAWAAGSVTLKQVFPDWLVWLSAVNLLAGFIAHFLMSAITVRRWTSWRGMDLATLLFPFYWVLHSLASFRALWQLFVKPHFWEKTTHGLSRETRRQALLNTG